ncbi:hypothetical protein C8F04DRAFT_572088 [Mycena alexandri]|uniref:Uncharacterized protein n=1 Tax=Mycena alexandri TaxID=1745969 RepID=A0AAD6SX43_9AGAR|nr:hypothetical protein C8F04DRAFT_572088 [Mycena alexandri]
MRPRPGLVVRWFIVSGVIEAHTSPKTPPPLCVNPTLLGSAVSGAVCNPPLTWTAHSRHQSRPCCDLPSSTPSIHDFKFVPLLHYWIDAGRRGSRARDSGMGRRGNSDGTAR